jgi:hypothetical protein
MEYKGQGTKIARALQRTPKYQLERSLGLRDGVPLHVYFVTDGEDDNGTQGIV